MGLAIADRPGSDGGAAEAVLSLCTQGVFCLTICSISLPVIVSFSSGVESYRQ